MEPIPEAIIDAALLLPESDRIAIVSRLLESLPTEESIMSLEEDRLLDELDRRYADGTGVITWPQLKAGN
jgi:hypothetical protein